MTFLPVIISIAAFALIVAGIVALVNRMRNRTPAPVTDEGIGTAKRLYIYIVAFAALAAAVSGVTQIGQFVLDGLLGGPTVSASSVRLAVGLALSIVGIPLWYIHWRMIGRSVVEHPSETGTGLRKLYIYAVLGLAVGIMAHAAVSFLQWIFRAEPDFHGYPVAALIIWGGVWAYHWRHETAEGQPTDDARAMRRFYLYIVSGAALVLLATGLARVAHLLMLGGYEALASIPVLSPDDGGLWRGAVRKAVIFALVGAAGWYSHWWVFAKADRGSQLRRLYLSLFATYGALITVLVALGAIINNSLVWGFGGGSEAAALYFRFFPGAIASLAAGIAVGVFHNQVAANERAGDESEWSDIRGWTPYLLTATGLVMLSVGIMSAISTVVGVFANAGSDILVRASGWSGGVALAITLALLGGPIWQRYWFRAQAGAESEAHDRRLGYSPRRTTLLAILAVGLLALLGGLSHVLFVFLRDLLGSDLGRQTVRDFQISIGILGAVLVFLPYYWSVYRAEQPGEVALPAGKRKDVSLLAPADAGDLLRRLESVLGYPVGHMQSADVTLPVLNESQLDAIVHRISGASGHSVLLIPDATGIRVVSYR